MQTKIKFLYSSSEKKLIINANFSFCQGHFHLINSFHYYIDLIWNLIASDIIITYTLYQFSLYMVQKYCEKFHYCLNWFCHYNYQFQCYIKEDHFCLEKVKGVGLVRASFGLKLQVHLMKDFGNFLNTSVSALVDSISLCERFELIQSIKTLKFKAKY